MDILEYMMKLSKINGNVIVKAVSDTVIKEDEFLLFLQKKQLSKGRNKDDKVLGTYTALTQKMSENPRQYGVTKPKRKKVAGQPYNMEWSGKLFGSLNVKGKSLNNDVEVTIYATNQEEIENKYYHLLGLTKESKSEFYDLLEIRVIEFLKLKLK